MTKVFGIPELLGLVCERARRSDLARLLTTSRLFFNCAVPVVWRILPESAPIILMRLIPDADVYLKTHVTLASIQPLDGQSLTRFNFYAPHIKQVARHQRNRQLDTVWEMLLRLVDTRSILPHLEALKFSLSIPIFEVQGPVKFISAHLCSTLVEIDHTRTVDAMMDPKDLSELVSAIAVQCPRIRSLKLNNVVPSLKSFHMSSLANSLAQLHDLRVLGLGPMVLDLKMMTILSSLPHLESLIFYDTYHSRKLEELLKSVNGPLLGSFSTLQHFGIKSSFNPERAARVWNISALVRGLTSVSVRIDSSHTQLGSFVRTICQCSPLISAFSLDCSVSPSGLGFLIADIIDDLALLPLQYLWLFGKDYPYVGSRWDGERFALAFPKMEHLRICGYYFTFEDLKFIAMHMPRLGQLSARVQLNAGWPSKDELSSLVFIPSPSQLYFRLQLASSHTIQGVETVMDTGDRLLDEIERLALALHALWPKGVICEPQRRLDEDGKPSYTSQINTALRALYEVSGDNAMGVNPRPRKHLPRWFGWI